MTQANIRLRNKQFEKQSMESNDGLEEKRKISWMVYLLVGITVGGIFLELLRYFV